MKLSLIKSYTKQKNFLFDKKKIFAGNKLPIFLQNHSIGQAKTLLKFNGIKGFKNFKYARYLHTLKRFKTINDFKKANRFNVTKRFRF